MWPNTQFPVDLVTFPEETLHGKLYFLCSARFYFSPWTKTSKQFGICARNLSPANKIFLKTLWFSQVHEVKLMMMHCFCGMVDWRKAFSLISNRDHCQRSSPSRISYTPPWIYKISFFECCSVVTYECQIMFKFFRFFAFVYYFFNFLFRFIYHHFIFVFLQEKSN